MRLWCNSVARLEVETEGKPESKVRLQLGNKASGCHARSMQLAAAAVVRVVSAGYD